MGRGFVAPQEVAGKERNEPAQHGPRKQRHGTDQAHQQAGDIPRGCGDEEERQRKRRHHGSELVNGQRADADLRGRSEPAGNKECGDNQRQHNAQAQEEQAAGIPEIEPAEENRKQRGSQENEGGGENRQVTQRERTQHGLVGGARLAAGRLLQALR